MNKRISRYLLRPLRSLAEVEQTRRGPTERPDIGAELASRAAAPPASHAREEEK